MTRRLVILAVCGIVWPVAQAADESLRILEALSVDPLLGLDHSERDMTGQVRWRP